MGPLAQGTPLHPSRPSWSTKNTQLILAPQRSDTRLAERASFQASRGLTVRESASRETMAHLQAPPAISNHRTRARGIFSPRTHDPLTHVEPEAFELNSSSRQATSHTTAGFDPLTSGEYVWMFASTAAIMVITAIGLYLCFGM